MTKFEMSLDDLRTDDYVSTSGADIKILQHTGPADENKVNHGTAITLKELSISRLPSI